MSKARELLNLVEELDGSDLYSAISWFEMSTPETISKANYKKLDAQFRKLANKTPAQEVSPEEAKKFHVTHTNTFDDDPHPNYKGKPMTLTDPAIAVKFNGKVYILDGQHRVAHWIKENKPVNIVIIDGEWMKKLGVNDSVFKGKGLRYER